MGKATSNNGSTARYILNIPEIDYFILDALIKKETRQLSLNDIKDYYSLHHLQTPTKAAFSQAMSRLTERGIIRKERHAHLLIEFENEQVAKAVTKAIVFCIAAEETIGGRA
jgi:hypothetical protein